MAGPRDVLWPAIPATGELSWDIQTSTLPYMNGILGTQVKMLVQNGR